MVTKTIGAVEETVVWDVPDGKLNFIQATVLQLLGFKHKNEGEIRERRFLNDPTPTVPSGIFNLVKSVKDKTVRVVEIRTKEGNDTNLITRFSKI